MRSEKRIHEPSWKPEGYYGRSREEMLSFVPPRVSRVIEVGCGEGEFGASLRGLHGIEVRGLEMSETVASAAAT